MGVYKQWEEEGIRYVSHRQVTAGRETGTIAEKGTKKVALLLGLRLPGL